MAAVVVATLPRPIGATRAAPADPALQRSPSPASRVRQQRIHGQNLRLQRLERERRLERYQRRLRQRR